MPWHVAQDHPDCPGGWAVVKDDDGTLAGCHPTEAQALEQVQALYAQEPDMALVDCPPSSHAMPDGSCMPDEQMPEMAAVEVMATPQLPIPAAPPTGGGTPWKGVLVVEGAPTGDYPRRIFAPGSLTWAAPPLALKWQPEEDEGHDGAVIVGRIDSIMRDGANIIAQGVMDDDGVNGAEALRLMRKQMLRGVSILADDTTDADVEYIYPTPTPDMMPEPEMHGLDMPMMEEEPTAVVVHHGRIRSATLTPEPAFVEAYVELGEPVVTAASYTLTIPEVWPEWWFDEPADTPPVGALHITPQGRVYGFLGPDRVTHRAFRASGRQVTIPRNVDYSEFQNKPCLVAGADGQIYRINAGNITFDCGHPSPFDERRADPAWAMQHYDNTCSIAARVRVGENRHGTWVAGGLLHGITADAFERMMASALSGDWQGGRLNAALLVPVEGFPVGQTSSVRIRDDALVASTVPIRYVPDTGPVDMRPTLERLARSIGRDRTTRFQALRTRVKGG